MRKKPNAPRQPDHTHYPARVLRAWQVMRGVTYEQISQTSGLSVATITEVFMGSANIHFQSLEMAAASLGLRVEVNFVATDSMTSAPEPAQANDYPLASHVTQ